MVSKISIFENNSTMKMFDENHMNFTSEEEIEVKYIISEMKKRNLSNNVLNLIENLQKK